MKSNTVDNLIFGGLIGGWAATLAFAIAAHLKLNKVSTMLEVKVEELVEKDTLDLPDDWIQFAVNRAVDSRYSHILTKECIDAATKTRNDIDKKMQQAVDKEFDRQRDDLAKELRYKINAIDISEVRKEVIEEAKETAVEKFKVDLDEVTNKYNAQLDQIATIYGSIASKMKGV